MAVLPIIFICYIIANNKLFGYTSVNTLRALLQFCLNYCTTTNYIVRY